MRPALALDGLTREQIHYDAVAAAKVAVELRSFRLVEAVLAAQAYVCESGAFDGDPRRKLARESKVSALKRLPASMRTASID